MVTGSTKGIGLAIAKEFTEHNGATVIVCSRDEYSAKKTAALLNGKTDFAGVDITSDSSIGKFMKKVLGNHQHIDILVNNAGYPFERKIWFRALHEIDTRDLQKILEVDTMGSVRLTKEVVRSMLTNDRGGVIINISSTPTISGHFEGAPYTMAKSVCCGPDQTHSARIWKQKYSRIHSYARQYCNRSYL